MTTTIAPFFIMKLVTIQYSLYIIKSFSCGIQQKKPKNSLPHWTIFSIPRLIIYRTTINQQCKDNLCDSNVTI